MREWASLRRKPPQGYPEERIHPKRGALASAAFSRIAQSPCSLAPLARCWQLAPYRADPILPSSRSRGKNPPRALTLGLVSYLQRFSKDVRHDTPQGNRTLVKPDPSLSSFFISGCDQSRHQSRLSGESRNPLRILDTGFRRCDEVLYGIRGDCPEECLMF